MTVIVPFYHVWVYFTIIDFPAKILHVNIAGKLTQMYYQNFLKVITKDVDTSENWKLRSKFFM